MKKNATVLMLLSCILLLIGCTSKKGIISLNTIPPGASVFVNGIKQGETPLEFQYDISRPATLMIEKGGYNTLKEDLNKAWVINENYKGTFYKEYIKVGDTSVRVWTVRTTRDLKEKGQ
jgi:hypothetical protein